MNENKINYDELKWNACSLFSIWIEYGDSKRREIESIEGLIDDSDDSAWDSILDQLESQYDYDFDKLYNDNEAIEAIKDGAKEALKNY